MGERGVRPLFVLSLPRSGSTLVQRVLAGHPGVATAPEPWVALPLVYALREGGVDAEYDHRLLAGAVGGFVDRLPGGQATFEAHVRRMLTDLYAEASPPGTRTFVDKTPRYHLIADDLARIFPDAAIVVVWRNPLAVAASMSRTWMSGRWHPGRFGIDLYTGLELLTSFVAANPDRVTTVRYEDLVTGTTAWGPVAAAAGVALDEDVLASAGELQVTARFGDPTSDRYDGISSAGLDRWRDDLAGAVRGRWVTRYLDWIGDERAALMGYDLADLRAQAAELPSSPTTTARDVLSALQEGVWVARRRWQGVGPVHREWPTDRWPYTAPRPRFTRDRRIAARSQPQDR